MLPQLLLPALGLAGSERQAHCCGSCRQRDVVNVQPGAGQCTVSWIEGEQQDATRGVRQHHAQRQLPNIVLCSAAAAVGGCGCCKCCYCCCKPGRCSIHGRTQVLQQLRLLQLLPHCCCSTGTWGGLHGGHSSDQPRVEHSISHGERMLWCIWRLQDLGEKCCQFGCHLHAAAVTATQNRRSLQIRPSRAWCTCLVTCMICRSSACSHPCQKCSAHLSSSSCQSFHGAGRSASPPV